MPVISARLGDYSPGSGCEHFDPHAPCLRFVSQRLGMTDIDYVAASPNPMLHDGATREAQMQDYRAQITVICKNWIETSKVPAQVLA